MDTDNKARLQDILSKRQSSRESIENFESFFVLFARDSLRKVVKEINEQLERTTGESLKVYYDDPIRFTNNQYFAQVVFHGHKTQSSTGSTGLYYNNNSGPIIKFEGNPNTAEVDVRSIYSNNEEFETKCRAQDLDYDKTFKVILDFLEKVYQYQ